MVTLFDLWLPIVVATLLVVGAAVVLWKFFPHHRGEGGPRALGSGALAGHALYVLIVTIVVAYIAGRTHPADAAYLSIFRVAGAAAILAYSAALIPDAIWGSSSWGATLRRAGDGLLYGLLTAGSLAGFWPAA
jgi:hypothetical protein